MEQAIREVHRVLRPGGRALIMLYHSKSFKRRVIVPLRYALDRLGKRRYAGYDAAIRSQYDSDTTGGVAPHVDTVDAAQVKQLFWDFNGIRIQQRIFSDLRVRLFGRHLSLARRFLLATFGRLSGHDVYIMTQK